MIENYVAFIKVCKKRPFIYDLNLKVALLEKRLINSTRLLAHYSKVRVIKAVLQLLSASIKGCMTSGTCTISIIF